MHTIISDFPIILVLALGVIIFLFTRKNRTNDQQTKINKKRLKEMGSNLIYNEPIKDTPFDKNIPQNGFGTFTFPSPLGTYTYTGMWKDGLKHGKGVEINASGNIINEGVWERGIYTYDKNGNEINYDEIQENSTSKPKPDSFKESPKVNAIDEKVPSAIGAKVKQKSLSDIIEKMSKLGPLNKEITQAQSWEDLKQVAMRLGVTKEQAAMLAIESLRRGGLSGRIRPTGVTEIEEDGKISENPKKILKSPFGTYEGYIKDGKKNGLGTMHFVSGNKYDGEWKDGVIQGQGTYTWVNGNFYQGEWKDDKRHGQGIFTWKEVREQYVGEYKDDKKNGQGTYTYADGSKLVGEWKDDAIHGEATMTWANGNKYVGEYKDGKMQGQGTLTWAGNKYVGEFKDGKMHGEGTYTSADGTVNKGRFVNSEFIG